MARPALWLRALSRYRATISPAPNFAYGLCVTRVSDAEMEGVDLSGWRTALNGAESVAPSVLRAFCDRFARWGFRPEALTPVYGLSEAALAVTFSDLEPAVPRPALRPRGALPRTGVAREAAGRRARSSRSAGRSRASACGSVDEAGRDLPDGRVGRVWVQGPSLMDGYLDDPEATARALRDGWLDTGDLGFLREAASST